MSNQLKKLLTEFEYLEQNSINIKKGSIFLAYPGEIKDGRHYINEAIEKGAAAIIILIGGLLGSIFYYFTK